MTPDPNIQQLHEAYRRGDLTLYLGAGVSVGNGLPGWEELVQSMYFADLDAASERSADLRPFPNYLFAISRWHLERCREPLDITARKIRRRQKSQDEFLRKLKETLYAGFRREETQQLQMPPQERVLNANPTLAAVADLCRGANPKRGVRTVITYNYDSLLEMALTRQQCQAMWKPEKLNGNGKLPIYHVHGFVPIRSAGSTAEEIVFTEEQYHQQAQDPYSWANLVQIQALTSSTGLMIGLSLSDRNMRRLLDALRKLTERRPQYALLKQPSWPRPGPEELERIHQQAMTYWDRFADSGVKGRSERFGQIEEIIAEVERQDRKQQQRVLEELGVHPIWMDDFPQIRQIVDQIRS
jgi:SIR2-like protein